MLVSSPALSARPTARCLRPRPRALPRDAVSMPDTVDKAQYDSRWEGMWGRGLEPGTAFDAAKPSAVLVDALKTKDVDSSGKRGFVPGCGRGYDLVALLNAGCAETVGLEISPTAVSAATDYLKSQGLEAPRAAVQQGDFFKDDVGTFDLGYDYTFFCALHPSMREDWAKAWARHMKPGGKLITLIFPVEPEPRDDGPPWYVHPDMYTQMLTANGFENVHLEAVDPSLSHKGRGGREYLGIWRKVHSSAL